MKNNDRLSGCHQKLFNKTAGIVSRKTNKLRLINRFLNRVISQVNIPIAKIIGNTLIVIRNQQTIRRVFSGQFGLNNFKGKTDIAERK